MQILVNYIEYEVGEKMPRESCRRIMKGYEFHEPTTVGEQLFLHIMVLFLWIKDSGQAHLAVDFGRVGGCELTAEVSGSI